MATSKKGNGTKRQSPSRERLLALALVRIIECVRTVRTMSESSTAPPSAEYEAALLMVDESVEQAQRVLGDNGYGNLESIATRVAALDLQMQAAIDLKQYKDFAPLGAALERAKRGLPPLTITEKKSKPATVEPRKPKVTKAVKAILEAFDSEVLADAEGRIVASVKADETGKLCMVEFGNNGEWVTVDPKELKPVTAKQPGTPATQGELSDATVQTSAT